MQHPLLHVTLPSTIHYLSLSYVQCCNNLGRRWPIPVHAYRWHHFYEPLAAGCCVDKPLLRKAMCLRQASLIKAAVQDALMHLKRSRPFSLRNAFEERMGCLSLLSAAIAKSVVGSDNAVFQASACGIMRCKLEHLEVTVQVAGTFWLFRNAMHCHLWCVLI